MATWAAFESTLKVGANSVMAKISKVATAKDAQALLKAVVMDYPNPAVRIMSVVIIASIVVAVLAALTNNYRYTNLLIPSHFPLVNPQKNLKYYVLYK